MATLEGTSKDFAKWLGRHLESLSEETKNSSELSFASSEVSFHSSELLFSGSVGNFCSPASYWRFPPWRLVVLDRIMLRVLRDIWLPMRLSPLQQSVC